MADPKDTEKKEPAKKPASEKKPAAKKPAAKTEAARKPAAKTEGAKKPAAKKPAAKKPAAKKPVEKKPAAKKPAAKPKTETKAKPKEPAAPVAPPVVRASAKYVRIAPRKARLIADQVRGLPIEDARSLLRFSTRSAAQDVAKLLDSAAANAENNHDLVADDLKVSEITVNEGPTLKRYRPRALGRATPIHKRTSHIAVALVPEED
ncbi:MAG: large subunit ribosomal protein [Solirubrobacterales bacterium]|jgi:ribosomal protein L22|nr:large subunit ribosomal protein [Solirubrobacterales bacterium]